MHFLGIGLLLLVTLAPPPLATDVKLERETRLFSGTNFSERQELGGFADPVDLDKEPAFLRAEDEMPANDSPPVKVSEMPHARKGSLSTLVLIAAIASGLLWMAVRGMKSRRPVPRQERATAPEVREIRPYPRTKNRASGAPKFIRLR